MTRRRIGIVGYGNIGKFLTNFVLSRKDLELAFVWNRTIESVTNEIDESFVCSELEDFHKFYPDLIVEVAHPKVTQKYGPSFLEICDFMVGSPTALANSGIELALRTSAKEHGLYIPGGALWGGQDIAKMSEAGTLKSLKISMEKHPSCFRLNSPLKEKNYALMASSSIEPVVLYEGPVRELCVLAPNNVNTMAAAALAAKNLGFDGVTGCLVSNNGLTDWHIVETEVIGPSLEGQEFIVTTTRKNPAGRGDVTGSATLGAFASSLLLARGKGPGLHLC